MAPLMLVRQEQARAGRRRALRSIGEVVVVATDDGRSTRETVFEMPLTLGELCARLGAGTVVTALRTERRPRSQGTRPQMQIRA